jgi:Protein of unknown function (DUF559)
VDEGPALEEQTRYAGLASLAARQHGVISRNQLLALGYGDGAIAHRVAQEALLPVHSRVFAVGHAQLHRRGWWMAAVLAGGPGALLSHRSAAALWGLARPREMIQDVTVARGSRRGPAAVLAKPGLREPIAFHQPRTLDPRDRSSREGIPVTTVSRTLLDLAEVIDRVALRRAFEEAERLRLLDLKAVESLLEAGLPLPDVNAWIAGCEVDAVWAAHGLVVELDGYEYHRTSAAFERDRIRDAQLQLAGFRVLRFTHRCVRREPEAVASLVRSILAKQGWPTKAR